LVAVVVDPFAVYAEDAGEFPSVHELTWLSQADDLEHALSHRLGERSRENRGDCIDVGVGELDRLRPCRAIRCQVTRSASDRERLFFVAGVPF